VQCRRRAAGPRCCRLCNRCAAESAAMSARLLAAQRAGAQTRGSAAQQRAAAAAGPLQWWAAWSAACGVLCQRFARRRPRFAAGASHAAHMRWLSARADRGRNARCLCQWSVLGHTHRRMRCVHLHNTSRQVSVLHGGPVQLAPAPAPPACASGAHARL
jgi:hypothetical protein